MKGIKTSFIFLVITILVISPYALYGISSTKNAETEIYPNQLTEKSEAMVFTARQEFVDSFERASLAPWTTYGYPGSVVMRTFRMRDTTNVYGPLTPAHSGYRYPGHPPNDVAFYPSPGQNPGNATCLESPTIDLTGWDSLFI